jgi:hypothetical protein
MTQHRIVPLILTSNWKLDPVVKSVFQAHPNLVIRACRTQRTLTVFDTNTESLYLENLTQKDLENPHYQDIFKILTLWAMGTSFIDTKNTQNFFETLDYINFTDEKITDKLLYADAFNWNVFITKDGLAYVPSKNEKYEAPLEKVNTPSSQTGLQPRRTQIGYKNFNTPIDDLVLPIMIFDDKLSGHAVIHKVAVIQNRLMNAIERCTYFSPTQFSLEKATFKS